MKAYAIGFCSAASAVLLVAAIWIGTQPKQEPGLPWGDTVYTSKQQFDGYLKSRGLSYKAWVARNPGAAPWEPEAVSVGAITVRASTKTLQLLLLAGVAWLLATAGAMLLSRGGRPGPPGFAKGSVALFSAVVASVLFSGIWFTTQSRQPAGLLWAGTTYTSKQEFKVYLKSKGLSYKGWVARNPGAAPWEPKPTAVRVQPKGAETLRAPAAARTPEAREDWLGPPLAAAVALVLTAGGALLLWRRRRTVVARYATRYRAFHVGALRSREGSVGRPLGLGSIPRLAIRAPGSSGGFKVAVQRDGLPGFSGAQGVVRRLIAGGRDAGRVLAELMCKWDVGVGKVAVGLITVVGGVTVGMVVVLFLPSV